MENHVSKENQKTDQPKFSKIGCFSLLIIVAIIGYFTYSFTKEKTPQEKAEYNVSLYLKQSLNDPDSYEPIEWGPIIKNGVIYSIRHIYRAKNVFGGYIKCDQIFFLNQYTWEVTGKN